MSVGDVEAIHAVAGSLRALLARARQVKQSTDIEPPLPTAELETEALHDIDTVAKLLGGPSEVGVLDTIGRSVIESGTRLVFYECLSSTSIDNPSFVTIWNLLDLINFMSDRDRCEPGLAFWLIEELMDSQTTDGCRKVFGYLESRRERLLARHFDKKNLIVLRTCNELLRRLSRAEDAVFCGRVFIFLFQSFPLGDKSSVNLRGEYHTENVTTYDAEQAGEQAGVATQVGDGQQEGKTTSESTSLEQKPQATASMAQQPKAGDSPTGARAEERVPQNGDSAEAKRCVDIHTLYPIFWSLQSIFSNPTRLFDAEKFSSFKRGLELTLAAFKEHPTIVQAPEKSRGIKRKRGEEANGLASAYNPKYLTSKDLFELELSDLAFQRHVLVQALIVMNFLLSLTPKAKKKSEGLNLSNKSVVYAYTLGDEDAAWALQQKTAMSSYIRAGPDGQFYHRMVDNVLSRDKNWVRWKVEGCAPIAKASVGAEEYEQARQGAKRGFAGRRMKSTPTGSLDLSFLSEGQGGAAGLDRLKDAQRFEVPAAESFATAIAEVDLDLEMAMTDENKRGLGEIKAARMWRALRVASRTRLGMLEQLEDGRKVEALKARDGDAVRGKQGESEEGTTKEEEGEEGAKGKDGAAGPDIKVET